MARTFVVQRADGHLAHYDLLGYVVAVVIGSGRAHAIQKAVMAKAASCFARALSLWAGPDAGYAGPGCERRRPRFGRCRPLLISGSTRYQF